MILTPFDPATLALIGAVLLPHLQEPAMAAPARAPVAAPAPCFEDMRLTADEAIRMLVGGRYIHVIVSDEAGDSRERWTRGCVRDALVAARAIHLTLPATRAIGFGLAVDRRQGGTLLIETDRNEVAAWLARQADRLVKG